MLTYKIKIGSAETIYTKTRPTEPTGIFRITVEKQIADDRKMVSSFTDWDLYTKKCTFEEHLSACEGAVNVGF